MANKIEWGVTMVHNEQNEYIGFRFKMIHNLIRRSLNLRFAETEIAELGGMQGAVVGYIYDASLQTDVFQKDIEKAFDIRRSTATVMLQHLEQKGYLVRQPVDYDARLKKVVLTDKAIRQNFAIRREIDRFHEELEEGITKEEKEELFRILEKVKNNLERKDKTT